jgi:hypothetical protein
VVEWAWQPGSDVEVNSKSGTRQLVREGALKPNRIEAVIAQLGER